MKVYLASWFANKDVIKAYANELENSGITCTSRWVHETVPHNVSIKDLPDEYHRETAGVDVDDILSADVFIGVGPSQNELIESNLPIAAWARGGRHWEAGFFYCRMLLNPNLKMIICGNQENIFHWLDGKSVVAHLPAVITLPTWKETKYYLGVS